MVPLLDFSALCDIFRKRKISKISIQFSQMSLTHEMKKATLFPFTRSHCATKPNNMLLLQAAPALLFISRIRSCGDINH